MDSTAQTKIELIYRLWNSQSKRTKDPNSIQFQPAQNLDALIVYNQQHGLRQKLSAFQVFTEGHRNKDLFDKMSDPEGLCIANLLKGYNSAFLTYGLQSRGKTHSLFGTDSIYNETRIDFNLLTRVYNEMKKQLPSVGISLSLIEIRYDEEEKRENIVDLLDTSASAQEDYEATLDFSGYTNVAVKTHHELEKVLKVGLQRSSNWAEKRDLDKSIVNQPKIEYHNNQAHLLCKLSFVNTTQKRQFSFYLVDLIGFNEELQDHLSQISLNQVNKFIDGLDANKNYIQSYRQTKLENLQASVARGGSYNVFTSQHMKIVSFLAQIILTSQTFFFVPFQSENEVYNNTYSIFERCFKLSTLKYPIEREVYDPTSRNNVTYQNYAKQADLTVNESTITGIRTPPNEVSVQKQDSRIHPFLAEGLSPINQMRQTRDGIYIQDNSGLETPVKEGLVQLSKIRNEVASSMGRVDLLQKKADEIRKNSPSKESDTLFSSSQNRQFFGKSNTGSASKKATFSDSDAQNFNPFSSSMKSQISSPKVKVQELIKQQSRLSHKTLPLNRDNFFADYNKKVKVVMESIQNFMVAEINTLKKENLPADYYHLRKNFDILYRVFKEGELVSNLLVQDFLELGNSVNEFKQGYDMQLQDTQQEQIALQGQFSQLIEKKGLMDIFSVYERDIQRLLQENESMKEHNAKIVQEIKEIHETEPRVGVITEYHILNKKYDQLQKQYGRIGRHLNETEEEITDLRKKERLFLVEKRMTDTIQSKTENLHRKIDIQDEKNKALEEKLKYYAQQNQLLRGKVQDQSAEIIRLKEDRGRVQEKAVQFKQLAKSPTELEVKMYKEARDSVRQDKMDRSPTSKRKQNLDKIYDKLNSFNY